MADLVGAFPKAVMPTPCRVLENGGEALVIRQYEHGQELLPGHARVWRTLSRCDGITVVLVWGKPHHRESYVEFVNGHQQPPVPLEPSGKGRDSFFHYVESWWRATSYR